MAKTYKCTNYGVCAEADKETIFQETDLEEVDGKFVCPKCGQELEEIKQKPKGNWILIAAIAAVLVAGGSAYYLLGVKGKGGKGPHNPDGCGPSQIVDTPKVNHGGDSTDTTTPPDTLNPVDPQPDPQPDPRPDPQPVAKTYNLGWGTYEGPMKGGRPHGLGGEVIITKSHTIDLKNGSYKQVTKGDRLVNTKFKDGKLVQGYIHHPGGGQESFTIGY